MVDYEVSIQLHPTAVCIHLT